MMRRGPSGPAACSHRRACQGLAVSSTRVHRRIRIRAPRARVYRALLDARGRGLDGAGRHDRHVHEFDPREGGAFRVSLTYDAPTGTGKTTLHTDTYRGRFV